ncbi:DUF4307 domain-containing protein [Leucobacter sp. UT-8R-CII-1-4]|uniref:DUF4307 domain-containing protein n=1 Tax=Leucobacter sp. UT-8R-CII-1-4 TaxID=3040075 RepID=UPI0024A84DE5|nr:DUF4307 domain-containing protein [Leucobacter sp. UT-8R-CII-1-4]MDI6023969.1 DUF4307 domain-containing protein [Leucobacter sp. UT-8R-CII-1-4]
MTDQASQSLLDERYGKGRKRTLDKRLGWVVGGAAVLTGLAFVLFGGWQQGSDLEFKDLHYSVNSETSVTVDVQVTAPADATVVCAVEALSTSHGTVGWKQITIPPGDERTRRFTSTMITTSPATTGRVRDCWELTGEA